MSGQTTTEDNQTTTEDSQDEWIVKTLKVPLLARSRRRPSYPPPPPPIDTDTSTDTTTGTSTGTTTGTSTGTDTLTDTTTSTSTDTNTPPPPRRLGRPRRAPPPPPGAKRPAQLDHAVRERLMTFDELSEKIGHKPKSDRAFGLYKMSQRYKAVEKAVGGARDKVAEIGGKPLSDVTGDKKAREAIEKQLDARLDELITKCEAYQKAHKDSRDAVQAMIDNARSYKQSFRDSLDKVLADPAIDTVGGKMTIDEAIFAKECGISFKDCKLDLYNDDKLDHDKSQEGFGAGAVNTVAKLVHSDGTERIFKPEQSKDPKPPLVTKTLGIDPKAPHYGNRNVATRAMSDVLGLDVVPQVDFATHNGSVGLLMAKAPGKPMRQKVWRDTTLQETQDAESDLKNGFTLNLKTKSLEKQENGTWRKGDEKLVKPWNGTPSEDLVASLHGELNGLEWCDMLTGQGDRHSANYMVDVQGDTAKVTGIDNDFAFGKTQTGLLTYNPGAGITSVGTPKLINRKIYDRIDATDFDRDMLPRLKGLLTDEEVDASRQRFTAVQKEARRLEAGGFVVGDWKTWRAPSPWEKDVDDSGETKRVPMTASEYLDAQGTPSLFTRDFGKFCKEDGVL